MLKVVDTYFRKESIDVARTLGAVCFVGAMQSILSAFASYVTGGKFHVNFFSVLGVVLSIGLWQRREIARKLALGVLYLTLLVFVWMIVAALYNYARLTVTGGVTLSPPTPERLALSLALTAPFPVVMILLLHMDKTCEEFRRRPTPSSPPSGHD